MVSAGSAGETEDVWLSTRVRLAKYLDMQTKQDREGIADFVFHRFRERYLIPLQNVLVGEENGFLMMAASCLLIEGLTAFRGGWKSTKGKSERAFNLFLAREEGFSALRGFERDFWLGVRCGILHRGETGNGWRLDFTHPAAPLVDKRSKRINCQLFLARLEESLENYRAELLNSSWEDAIWKNLREKMQGTIEDCNA